MKRILAVPNNCNLCRNRNHPPRPFRSRQALYEHGIRRQKQQKRWNSGGADGSSPTPPPKNPLGVFLERSKAFGIGAIAGTCGSLAGMGGGFVMIPLMTSSRMGLLLTQHQAHATSLFAVATTGLAGAISYSSLGDNTDSHTNSGVAIDTEVALMVALFGMATASLGAHASARLSQTILKRVLGMFMLAVAPTIPARDYLLEQTTKTRTRTTVNGSDDSSSSSSNSSSSSDNDNDENHEAPNSSFAWRYLKASGIGCCSGFLAGMFGVGGGAVVVPALSLFMDMNHYQALGTSLCAMVPTAIVGTATHMSKGTVAMRIAPALALGAFTGGLMGGKLGLSIPEQKLKYGFSGTMVVLGLRTILKA